MRHRVGQNWAISFCAAALIFSLAATAFPRPTSRPAHSTRIDLLYLHARLLTYDAGLPDSARPVLAAAAKQKTWTSSHTPVALLTPGQVESLLAAYTASSGAAITRANPPMLVPNHRVTASPRPAATTSPSDRPRFDITATAGAVDAQDAIPLKLSATAAATFPPAPPDRAKPFTATWSATLGVAAPVEQTLLIDLGAPATDNPVTPGRPPRAFLLIRPSAQPVDRKDPAAAMQVAGDLYRSWDRIWPLLNELSASIHARQYADGRRQASLLREQLRPVLDAAEGTDFDRSAAAMAEDLDSTATALRRFDLGNASRAFMRFQHTGNKLHADLTRVMADSGRLPTGPETRPNSR